MKYNFIFSIIASSMLFGCMVGPDYENPDNTIGIQELKEPNFTNRISSWKSATPSDRAEKTLWDEVFNDPLLSEYMQKCRSDNPDLKSLFYKLEQARQKAGMTESHLYPTVSGGGDYLKVGISDNSVLPIHTTFDDWLTGASLTWDADLFGRVRSMLYADRASAESLMYEYENLLLMLQAQSAVTYFSIREFEAEKILLEKTVKTREQEREFIEKRVKISMATDSDLQRAIEQEYSAKADLTQIHERIAIAKNYLANLLGTSSLKLKINAVALNTDKLPDIPKALPSQLLERRADIAAAERRVCMANYQIGAAQAAFFPTITITSAVGVESSAFSKLIESSSFAWGVSPQIYIPIFQAGRLIAQKKIALAKHQQTLQDYKSVVLKAVKEVEDALAKTNYLEIRYEQRLVASNAANKVKNYTLAQYKEVVCDYFAASQAQRYALLNELACLQIRGEQYRNAVSLIKSLGGSWQKPKIVEPTKLEAVCPSL